MILSEEPWARGSEEWTLDYQETHDIFKRLHGRNTFFFFHVVPLFFSIESSGKRLHTAQSAGRRARAQRV